MTILVVSSVVSNLKSLIQDGHGLNRFLHQELEKLKESMIRISTVLENDEETQLHGGVLHKWMGNLKDDLYMLDDFLDELATEVIRDKIEGEVDCAFFKYLHPRKVMFHQGMIGRIKAVREKMDFIQTHTGRLNLHNNARWNRETCSFCINQLIYGRDGDKENIVNILLKDASKTESLRVCPIVAMGGMGKTALAQLVYNDDRVREHFELRIWIWMSGDFDLGILIQRITGSPPSGHVDSLDKLRVIFGGKRYLLVIDDVWDADYYKWEQWKHVLSCGSNGSSILFTTRQENIARMASISMQPYHLAALSHKACWEIIKERAFGSEVQRTDNFVKIGKKIAAKCTGVPVVARMLGDILRDRHDEKNWLLMKDRDLWDLLAINDDLFQALRLSYSNVTPELRRCFSYCAVFPMGYMIEKEDFIHLLMANGFICESTKQDVETVGDAIIHELYWRSMIQDVKKDESGNIYCFKLHDLFHGLVQSILADECCVAQAEKQDLPSTTRHLSIDHVIESSSASYLLKNVESLRTLIYLSYVHSSTLFDSNLLKHTRLRALNLSMVVELRELPPSICVLKHLRYLNLSDTEITELPESICSLWNLQILNLNRCTSLKALPKCVGCLRCLRHLCMRYCWSLSSMPGNIGKLTSLRTLSCVIIGENEKLEFQLIELGCLKYLRGKLEIAHLERVRDVKHAHEANLTEKGELEELSLTWGKRDESRVDDDNYDNYDGGRDDDDDEQGCDPHQQNQIFEALRPPPRLKYLEVTGFKGPSFPDWIINGLQSFRYIKSVRVSDCKSCSKLPPLWRLPSLKSLRLESLNSLRCLIEAGEEYFTFKSLEKLEITSLPRLERITSREEATQDTSNNIFPRLSNLFISKCPRLSFFTLYPLQSLRSYCIDNKAVLQSMGISTSKSTSRTSSFSARRR